MKIDPQYLPPKHEVFYKRKKFLLILNTSLFLLSLFIVFLFIGINDLLASIGGIIFAAGAVPYWFLLRILGVPQDIQIAVYIYAPILALFLFFTLKTRFSIKWLYIFTIHFIITTVFLVITLVTFPSSF